MDGDTETDDGETDGELTAGTGEVEDTNMRITALKASYESVCHSKWIVALMVTAVLDNRWRK